MRDNRDILDKLRWLSNDIEYMEVPGEWLPPVTEAAEEIERLRKDLSLAVFADNEYWQVLERENERLRAALELYREAVRIDATMEGPKFMGSNASALKRAWDADRAALEEK